MGNQISESFETHGPDFAERADRIARGLFSELGFVPETEIFRGKIYDDAKLRTLIFRGKFGDRSAVLKIQGLRPSAIEEPEILEKFAAQNRSKKIRVPEIFRWEPWDAARGFGFALMEDIRGTPIWRESDGFPTGDALDIWVKFLAEFRQNAAAAPFLPQENRETRASFFVPARVAAWAKIADGKGQLTPDRVRRLGDFFAIYPAAAERLGVRMAFAHGHLGADDAVRADDDFVIFANALWGFRPELYDAAFGLWMGLKSPKRRPFALGDAIRALDDFCQKIAAADPALATDPDFAAKFDLAFFERCAGVVAIDLENQNYDRDGRGGALWKSELLALWDGLFDEFARRVRG